ncbi:MAG TPA: PIN domain-containing protein [Acidobacteriaceae bacterium]
MSYLLDTDVVSQFTKQHPDALAFAWLSKRILDELYLSVATITELREGMELLPAGKKRSGLEAWLESEVKERFRERILPMTLEIADRAGKIAASAVRSGHNPEALDVVIAATAQEHGLSLATLNRKHFERLGVELVTF